MAMNALAPISGRAESHINLPSPSTSPRLIQHPPDIIKSEPITDIHLAKWKAEDDLVVVKANRKTPDSHSSAAAAAAAAAAASTVPFFCQPPAAIDTRKCEPMSPPDNYSVTSSPQTFAWPPSSDSGESEPWTLHHHELLPDHSAYANSPSSPASGWDCAVPYQFQNAPTSAAYFPDCSGSFPTSTPPPMQANSYSPVFEMASSYGSPHYPPSHFGDVSPTQHRPMTSAVSDMNSLGNEPASHHDYSGVMPTPPSDYPCTSDMSKAKTDINSLPYSQLLYRAFMSSNTRKLSLRQIYQWFEDNTNKAVNNKGWQNSIRHNLSMNRAFEKAPLKEDGTESRRATEWVLADWALQEGVQSTTRYRKGNIRSKSHGSERERMAHSSYSGGRRGIVGYSARGRERLYGHHRMPMHGMAPDSHVLYGAPVTVTAPAHSHAPHLASSPGFSEVEGYVPQAGGLCYSPMDAQEGYSGFSQDEGSNYSSYSMYNLGETNMGEYAIVGGVADSTLAGAHGGNVAAPPPTVAVAFGPPLAMSHGQQQQSSYTQHTHGGGYDTRQGISEVVHE